MIYPRGKRNLETHVIRSNSPRGNTKVYMDMLITSSSRMRWRMYRNMSLIGRTSSRKYTYIFVGRGLIKRLAAEYGLQLVYKKAFNEILSEEQSSRDFGPLLAKMGVLNAEGASNMDEAQWEAASKS